MIDNETKQQIEATIDAHVAAGNTFSAWEVTREIRSQGVRLQHSEAKEIVHTHYLDGKMVGYDRELRPANAAGDPAWFYFPEPVIPAPGGGGGSSHLLTPSSMRSYGTPIAIGGAATPWAPQNVSPSMSRHPVRRHDNPLIKAPDDRGRLLIPKHLTAMIGLSPGDRAYLHQHAYRIEIEAANTSILTGAWRIQKVDHHGGLYLSRRTQDAGSLKASERQIEAAGNIITVTDAS